MKKHFQKISKYRPSVLQGTLHFEVARPRAHLSIEHPWEPRARSILSIVLATLVAGYLYFVAASILHVMARTEALGEMQTIQSGMASLEQQYFALSQGVTPQEGAALGFSPVSKTSYVFRPGNAAKAGSKANEI
jgi:hypothetical protein